MCNAHKADEAFFKYSIKAGNTEVLAELPWTIRTALIKFRPELKNATSKKDFEVALHDYVQENLKLYSKGTPLKLLSVEAQQHEGHSHQVNYLFTFKGSMGNRVINKMLCDIFEEQQNFNYIKNIEYITTSSKKSILLPSQTVVPASYSIGALIIVFAFIALVVFKKRSPVVFDRVSF